MKLNITQMRDYLKCPQYSYNLHVLRRGSDRKSVPLEVGSMFHEAMEEKLTGTNVHDKFNVSEEALDAWDKHKLWLPINAFTPDPGWDIRAVETVLEAVLAPGIELQGRLDGIIKYNGKYWSLQWKTYEDDLQGLLERVRLSWHEAAYQWLAERNNLVPWGGTILGACEKMPGYWMRGSPRRRTEITDAERAAGLTFHYLFRSAKVQKRMEQDLRLQLTRCASSIQDPVIIGRNYDACWTNRMRCPYYTVCHEGGDLKDERFVDIQPRY